jgi:hypothetical protein
VQLPPSRTRQAIPAWLTSVLLYFVIFGRSLVGPAHAQSMTSCVSAQVLSLLGSGWVRSAGSLLGRSSGPAQGVLP